jgi:hypothetical protein
VNYSTLNIDGQKALRLKGFNTVYFDLSHRKRRTIKRDTNLVGKTGKPEAMKINLVRNYLFLIETRNNNGCPFSF